MLFLSSVTILFFLVLISVIIGRQLFRFLPERLLRENAILFISPILGFSLLIVLSKIYGSYWAFNFKLSIYITLALILLSLIFEKNYKELVKNSLITFLLGFVVALPVIAPLFLFDSYNTFNDTFTYLAQSQWLQTHSFSQNVVGSGNYPVESQIYLYQTQGSRMGASFFLAFTQSLFALQWSYYAYLPVLAFVITVASMTLSGIIREITSSGINLSLALGALVSFTLNGFIFGAQFGFFPQTFGLCFLTGFIYLFPKIVWHISYDNRENNFVNLFKFLIPFSLILSAFIYCYNDMFLVVSAVAGFYIIFCCSKTISSIRGVIKLIFLVSIQLLIFVNVEFIRFYKSIIGGAFSLAKGEAQAGWPVLWSPIEFYAHSFGFKSALDLSGQPILFWIDFFISHIVFIVIIFGLFLYFFKSKKNNKKINEIYLLIIAANLIYILLFIKFRYFSNGFSPGEIGNTFLQWKLSKWLAPFNLVLLAALISKMLQRNGRIKFAGQVTFGLFVLFGAYINVYLSSLYITSPFMAEVMRKSSGFDTFLNLRSRVEAIPKDDIIYLGMPHEHHKLSQMVMYVLSDRKLAGKYEDGYIRGSIPEGQRDMPISGSKWFLRYKPLVSKGEDPLARVGPFYLYRTPFAFYDLSSISGAYATEGSDLTGRWNWIKGDTVFKFNYFHHNKEMKKYKLRFQYLINGEEKNLKIVIYNVNNRSKVFSDEIHLGKGWGEYESLPLELFDGPIEIHFVADGEATKISRSDDRQAKYVLQNLSLD